jgi:two-component system, cell cycle response regulator DivK
MLTLNAADWQVLVVDDEPDNLLLLEVALSFEGATVTCVRSGQAALALLSEQTFDLGLLDIRMPHMSGWDLIKEIRAHPKAEVNRMFLIAATAHALEGDKDRVMLAGFNGYISKPLEITNLIQVIRNFVQVFVERQPATDRTTP